MPSIVREENDSVKPLINGDGHAIKTNAHLTADHEDAFHRLPKLQQDILQLHGPRQKYSVDKAGEIPQLRSDREILVQVRKSGGSSKRELTFQKVVAIGLNPVVGAPLRLLHSLDAEWHTRTGRARMYCALTKPIPKTYA